MNIASWLERRGRATPSRAALGLGPHVVADFAQFTERAARIAGALLEMELARGDRVAIIAWNSPEYLEILFGVWWAGLAATPANAKLHGAELGYILEHSGARVAFVSGDLEAGVAAHAPESLDRLIVIGSADHRRMLAAEPAPCAERSDDDLAWLFYTSGTTGRPKGAMLTHGVLAAASLAYALEVDPIAPGDALLHAAPMSHGSGLYVMAHVLRGGVNVAPESGGFDPLEIFATTRTWRNLSMFAAPTMVKRMTESPGDVDATAFRTIVWGGAPMYVEDAVRAVERFGPRFAQIYGQGECPMTITTLPKDEVGDTAHPRWRERLATAGRAFANVEAMIVDSEDRPLVDGEAGEIVVRGAPVTPGYWKDPAATARALRGGWLHTGDVGSLDSAGYLTLKDRSKDLVISGGSNIYPREVEEVLLRHPAVREASVIGRPDDEWGEIVVAYVVGEATAAELDALCLASIARFKRPKHYLFVSALPKNNYGKILKTELRALDAARREGRDG